MRLPAKVTIVEVGLRDGIQAEPALVPTAEKLALAAALVDAGVSLMEATAFVHPVVVPQMADAETVMGGVPRRPGVRYAALAPNQRGVERALATRVDEVRYAVMTSETFNRKNVRMSVAESMAAVPGAIERCAARQARFVGTLGTCFGCPYEGDVPQSRVLALVGEFVAAGASGVTLCDTTGMANPLQVARLCAAVRDRWPELELNLHFHNTRGAGLANVLGALEAGVERLESSLGGAGGCPFAPRATGNICTEDTVHMLADMGVETGLNLAALIQAAHRLESALGHELPGQVMKAGPRSQLHPA